MKTKITKQKSYTQIIQLISIMILVVLGVIFSNGNPQANAAQRHGLFLPVIVKEQKPAILIGVYPDAWLGDQAQVDAHLNNLSEWSGKKVTFAGTFIGLETVENYTSAVTTQFDMAFENGYTPFANIMSKRTAREIADGNLDRYIRQWAQAVKAYARDGGRIAYLAPLPEMNGDWTSYGLDPAAFKQAYRRFIQIFNEEGVPKGSVRWVFAPNGGSEPGHEFENYYPGDDVVDAIGISTYNYGYCVSSWPEWNSLKEITDKYVKRMNALAPSKPMFLTQVGTSSETSTNYYNEEAKSQWFRDGFAYLADSGVRGFMYFNFDNSCDFAMYRVSNTNLPNYYEGYRDAVSSPEFGYMSPDEIRVEGLQP